MIIGIVVQKYYCNNLGVYALSYCSINSVITYCKKNKKPIEVRIFTEEYERVCDEVKSVFEYANVKAFPIIDVWNINSYLQYSKRVAECDVILDTGLGDGFSDIYSDGKFLLQYFLKRIPEFRGCCTILLPQTIGPYKKPLFEKLAAKVIKNAAACFVRDDISWKYANDIASKSKIIRTTDMAMRLPKSKKEYEIAEGINIGLNISGLLYMGGFTKSNHFNLLYDYSVFVDKLIEILIEKEYKVHLIAHVYRNNGEGDEFAIKALSEKYKEIIVAPEFASPMDAKSYISQMDFFIGSRMHSTIAAISTNVPVCPIGYSRKFNGLFETIGYKNYIDATNETIEDSLDRVIRLIDDKETVKRDVAKAGEQVEKLYDVFNSEIEKLFDKYLYDGDQYENKN